MKPVVLVVLISFFVCQHGFAQKRRGEILHLFKRSYKIDSLLTELLDSSGAFMTKDSCFTVIAQRSIDNDGTIFLAISMASDTEVNMLMHAALLRHEYLDFLSSRTIRYF